jgi:hypothetical protein
MERDEGEQPDRRAVLKILGGGLVGLFVGLDGGWRPGVRRAEGAGSVLQVIPRRPRPVTPSPALFSGKTAQAYRIAKDVPELIEQMPCYCGCVASVNHQSNLDCYADRHADG